LERKNDIYWHLFIKIMEIGENEGERSQVVCEEENEGK